MSRLTNEQIEASALEFCSTIKCDPSKPAEWMFVDGDLRLFARAIESAVHRALNPSGDQSGADGKGVQPPDGKTEQMLLTALRRAALALAFAAESSPAMRDDYEAVVAAIEKATRDRGPSLKELYERFPNDPY